MTVAAFTYGVKGHSATVTSANGGTGNTTSGTVTVIAPPTIFKRFGATGIIQGGTTTLAFEIQNTNLTTPMTGVAFTDSLPGGLVVATPNGLTGSCGGGTITATAYVLPGGQTLTGGATASSPNGAATPASTPASASSPAAPAVARVTP